MASRAEGNLLPRQLENRVADATASCRNERRASPRAPVRATTSASTERSLVNAEPIRSLSLVLVLLATAVGGVAAAHLRTDAGAFHGCAARKDGALRLVAPGKRAHAESPLFPDLPGINSNALSIQVILCRRRIVFGRPRRAFG